MLASFLGGLVLVSALRKVLGVFAKFRIFLVVILAVSLLLPFLLLATSSDGHFLLAVLRMVKVTFHALVFILELLH